MFELATHDDLSSRPSVGDVTAIIVSHNSGTVLHKCLASLNDECVKIIVVDNASSDDSVDVGMHFGAQIARNSRNEGFGRAMNRGMQLAETPFLLLVNPDITFEPGAIKSLLEAAHLYPNAAILAPRFLDQNGKVSFANRSILSPYLKNEEGVKWTPEGDCCTPFLLGACWLAHRDILLALGGFDPEIFLFFEDDDLCRRAIEAGYSLVHVHGAVAQHEAGTSSAQAPGRIYKARYHLAWSRLYVAKKWHLTENPWPMAVRAGLKWLVAAALCNRKRKERYAGTVHGFLAHRKGLRALSSEGLE